MKKLFVFCLLSVFVLSSCKKDDSETPQVKSISVTKINIENVSYFAIISSNNNLKSYNLKSDSDTTAIPLLCVVDSKGEMKKAFFQYDLDGASNAAKDFVENNLFIVPSEIIPIGNDYIWLHNTNYYVTNRDECPEEIKSAISLLQDDCFQYVIRKKDGGIINLEELKNAMPFIYEASSNSYMSNGYISPTENGFYVRESREFSRIITVIDNGSSTPTIEYIWPNDYAINYFVHNNEDYLVAMASPYPLLEDILWQPIVLFPDGRIETILEQENLLLNRKRNGTFVSVDNKFYYIVAYKNQKDESEVVTYRLNCTQNKVELDSIRTQIVPFVYSDIDYAMPRYSENSTIAFMSRNKLITFSSEKEMFETKEITEFRNVTESFPSTDGCIYGYEDNSLNKIYCYNTITEEVSIHTIDKSSISTQFLHYPHPKFDASGNIFVQSGANTQGKGMIVITDINTDTATPIEANAGIVYLVYKL